MDLLQLVEEESRIGVEFGDEYEFIVEEIPDLDTILSNSSNDYLEAYSIITIPDPFSISSENWTEIFIQPGETFTVKLNVSDVPNSQGSFTFIYTILYKETSYLTFTELDKYEHNVWMLIHSTRFDYTYEFGLDLVRNYHNLDDSSENSGSAGILNTTTEFGIKENHTYPGGFRYSESIYERETGVALTQMLIRNYKNDNLAFSVKRIGYVRTTQFDYNLPVYPSNSDENILGSTIYLTVFTFTVIIGRRRLKFKQ